MAKHGGKIAPDGRATQAKGIGKNSKRHDLEQPATPGISDSDLQQGDVQRLEQSQKIAPRPKRTQQPSKTTAPPRRQGAQRGSDQFAMEVPDPVQMAQQRAGGNPFSDTTADTVQVDPGPWMPMLEAFASAPNTGGPITAQIIRQLSNFRRNPIRTKTRFIDMNEADEILEGIVGSMGPQA